MLDDYQLIQHSFPSSITLIPIADVHIGSIGHNKEAWESFLRIVDRDESIRLGLVGDLCDNSTKNSIASPYDCTIRPREQKERMVEYLRPLASRILFSVNGNHEARSREVDMDISYDIMARLCLEDLYRENMAFVKISCGERNDASRTNGKRSAAVYTIAATHGTNNNKLNAFSRNIDNCDVMIAAHTHDGMVKKPTKLVIDTLNNVVTEKTVVTVVAESWLSWGGYAARKMLLPSESANPQKIILSDSSHRKNIEVRW